MSEISIPTEAAVISKEKTGVPKFLTVAELVAATKVSRQTISRKLKLKEIPHVRVGSRILIPVSFLLGLENMAWSNIKQVKR